MSPGREIRRITAQEEFEKNPDLNQEDIDHLRDWVAADKHLPYIPDEMLILFHHSCYYDLVRTKECIDVYYTVRTQATELFTNRDVTSPALEKSMSILNTCMLPVPDPNGYCILYHSLKDTDPSKYVHSDAAKLVFMTSDTWLVRHGTAPGFVLLVDFKGARLAHLTRVNFSIMRYGAKYVQEGSPVRLKAIHVINTVSWIDKIMGILKSFVNKSILDLFHFYQSDSIEKLYQYIPKECLPSDFGGTLPCVEKLCAENNSILESMRDYFEEDERTGRVDETKREKKKKNKKEKVELIPETSFKRLEID